MIAVRIGLNSLLVLRLNPYSNGICSMIIKPKSNENKNINSLNPYSNGICSMRMAKIVTIGQGEES